MPSPSPAAVGAAQRLSRGEVGESEVVGDQDGSAVQITCVIGVVQRAKDLGL